MNKLDGIKKGDRVKVTFEGLVSLIDDHGVTVSSDGIFYSSNIKAVGVDASHVGHPTFQIDRIATPVQIGDIVTWGTKVASYKLVAIEGEMGIVWSGGFATAQPLKNLVRP